MDISTTLATIREKVAKGEYKRKERPYVYGQQGVNMDGFHYPVQFFRDARVAPKTEHYDHPKD